VDARLLELLSGLINDSPLTSFDQLPGLLATHAGPAGMAGARVYVADLQGRVLREVTGRGLNAGEGGEVLAVDGTLPGRAFALVQPLPQPGPCPDDGRGRWWVPVLDGTERLGVLRADLAPGVDPAQLETLASLLGMILVSKRATSDAAARLMRTRPMNVAAELQWNLMPPPAYAGHDVTVGAALEPAYAVGGDAFDYAVAGRVLHLSVLDAMGHDTTAGLTANVAVAAARNARRQGLGLAQISQAVEEVLIGQFGNTRYVTGIFADLDLDTGVLGWVNRGHHPPILVRGGRWTRPLACPPAGPMGAGLGLPVHVCREQLEPGDSVLLHTDGITEARDPDGNEFGLDRFTDFVVRHHSGQQTLHETLRRLMRAVLHHHHGSLDDDATVLLTEWRGSRHEDLIP